jgi:hypothetical protein
MQHPENDPSPPADQLARLTLHAPDATSLLAPLVVFTPYLAVPPCGGSSTDPSKDPFEDFVRGGFARRQYHRHPGRVNVRHVPYVARAGMTAEHRQHLREAGAVVVVVCAPGRPAYVSDAHRRSEQQIDGIGFQMSFANDVAAALLVHQRPNVLVAVDIKRCDGSRWYGPVVEVAGWESLGSAAGVVCEYLSLGKL